MDVRIAAGRARPGRRIPALLCRDERQADFGVRRFRLTAGPQREILETASRAFLAGYNAVVSSGGPAGLAGLPWAGEEQRGHVLEGAGMAAAVLDLLTAGRGRRLRALLAGPGRCYPQQVLAGAGQGYAILRMRPSRLARALPADQVTHPALRWFAWDGYGFHRGFFHSDAVIGGQRRPRRLTAEQQSLFDQGVGRSIWFHECADPDGVALRIAEFEPARRGALWSGAGLAATYTGGSDVADLGRLAALAGKHRADLAHGSALACAAWAHAGQAPAHTGAAAHALTGALADEAAGWVAAALGRLGHEAASPGGYQRWRQDICDRWTGYRAPGDDMTGSGPAEPDAAGLDVSWAGLGEEPGAGGGPDPGWPAAGDAAGTGGQDTGGQDTGGQDTGGQDTGGQDTGGQDTGGQDTGGQDSGGPEAWDTTPQFPACVPGQPPYVPGQPHPAVQPAAADTMAAAAGTAAGAGERER